MNNQMENPLVSIIIPIYKVERFLERCVQSVITQTYRNLEIILIDDGSPDRCPQLCDKLSEDDTRIKVIHKKNGGLSDARNCGIEHASGEYLFFLDSDDWIRKDTISILLDRCITDGSDMAICDIEIVNDSYHIPINRMEKNFEIWDKIDFWNHLFSKYSLKYAVAWSKLYIRKIFDETRFPLKKINEDEFVLYDIIEQCERISVCDEKLYFYFQRDDSIMHQRYSLRNLDGIEAYLDRAGRFLKAGSYHYAEKTIEQALRLFAIFYIKVDQNILTESSEYMDHKKKCIQMYREIPYTSLKTKLHFLLFNTSPALFAKIITRKYSDKK